MCFEMTVLAESRWLSCGVNFLQPYPLFPQETPEVCATTAGIKGV